MEDRHNVNNYGRVQTKTEPLEVLSGRVLLIDQFMLGNKQFIQEVSGSPGSMASIAASWGGFLASLKPGSYRVFRDPQETLMVVYPAVDSSPDAASVREGTEETPEFDLAAVLGARASCTPQRRVFIDTRCVVFVDAAVLSNSELLDEYSRYRYEGMDKKARDLLRKNGAAIRYGFDRFGDELGVHWLEEAGLLALWPVVDEAV